EKDTVDFTSNYDDRLQEPDVLPAAYPNLLVNGSTGIAVGMSTKIPPHNLGEVIDATIHLIDHPDCTVADLMEHVEGPDFPTGANIVGRGGVHKAYTTGRGRIRVRAEFEVEPFRSNRERIIVTELPYQENKARLVERIANDVNAGKIEGVSDLRDESDRDGVRVVIELKRGANTEVVKNQLLEHHLESTFGVINLALVDGQPRVLTLKETLEEYVRHRREVVRRRSQYDLAEAEDRAHILEGRLTALENVEEVVDLVRNADDRDAAKAALRDSFEFSEEQAEHIVRMQLGSLTSLEREEIQTEYENVQETIEYLQSVLGSASKLDGVIKDELREIKETYADERRTRFVQNTGEVTHEDLIPEEDVVVVLSEEDYIKRMPLDRFRTQRRGGKGIIGTDLKESDRVSSVFVASTHDDLLVFTNHGQVYEMKAYRVPEMSRTARGKSAVNLLEFDDGEEIAAVVNCESIEEDREHYLTMVTRDGYVKRTSQDQFGNILSTGIRAIKLEEGDALADVEVTDGEADLVVATEGGMTIRFDEDEVRPMGRTARGVRGIRLTGEDRVAGVAAVEGGRHRWLLTVTANGYGKRTDIDRYRKQSRNGKGLIDIKTNERNGPSCAIEAVGPGDDLVVMSQDGQIMRTSVEDVSTVGRNTMGVIVMDLDDGDTVAAVTVVPADAGEDAADEESENAVDELSESPVDEDPEDAGDAEATGE
ncbi:MAG: DNA gyrase subunit A, partial [Salinigranum sp.]